MKTNLALLFLTLGACTNDNNQLEDTDLSGEEQAILAVKDVVDADLVNLYDASEAIQTAAPEIAWDADETTEMKSAWKDARSAYERIEGAIAVLFPELDASTDERYDGFIEEAADPDLFDGEGVTGVHGIERILWADAHPSYVVDFESELPNYTAAAFPSTDDEALAFKNGLVQRLVDDVQLMQTQFEPLALDPAAAYDGVVGSMAEQVEKVSLASTGEDESRYAQHTLADMRANLAGGLALYEGFSHWLLEQDGGEVVDADIREGFARVADAYDAFDGDGIPLVPEGWNADAPTDEHLATEYGQLWTLVQAESDPAIEGSLVERMAAAAALLDISVAL